MIETNNKTLRLHCNTCARSTDHLIVYSHRNSETDEDVIDSVGRVIASISGHHDWQLLECQGCKTVCLLSKQFFSEWAEPWEDPYVRTYFPPRNTDARAKPHWFDDLIEEPKLQGSFILVAYKQIYSLIESSYFIAAMLTCRALLETIAIEHGDGDRHSFKEKLKALSDAGFIRNNQIEHLDKAIYDAASAVMHRSYNPSPRAVTYVLDAVEQLLHAIYIEPLIAVELHAEKPPRKK